LQIFPPSTTEQGRKSRSKS